MRDGADVETFFEKLEECGGEALELFIRSEIDKRVRPEICKLTRTLNIGLKVVLRRVTLLVEAVSLLVDSLDGFLIDVENFSILGRKVVPLGLTRPFRRVVDRLLDGVENVRSSIDEVFNEISILEGYCNGSENEDE